MANAERAVHPSAVGALLTRAWFALVALLTLVVVVAGMAPRFHVLVALARQGQAALHRSLPALAHGPIDAALSPSVFPYYVLVVESLVVLGFMAAAVILNWRRADGRALLFGTIFITIGTYFTRFLDALQASDVHWQPLVHAMQAYGVIGSLLFFFVFPDGRFVPRWTALLAVPWAVLNVTWVIWPGVPFNFSNPYILSAPWFWIFAIGWLVGIGAQTYRYLHLRDARLRRQTRWIVLSTISGVACYGIYVLPLVLFPALGRANSDANILYNVISVPVYFTLLISIPVCILIALLHLRLWDVDIIVNRALVYSTLTGCIAAIYLTSIIVLQIALTGLAGGSQVALAGSTLGVALLFQPLRQRIQRTVDQRLYHRKYANMQTVATFVQTLEHQTDLDQLQQQLVGVVEKTTQPGALALWLRDADDLPTPPGMPLANNS